MFRIEYEKRNGKAGRHVEMVECFDRAFTLFNSVCVAGTVWARLIGPEGELLERFRDYERKPKEQAA